MNKNEALKMAMRGIESMFNAPDSTLFAPDWLKIYNACKEALEAEQVCRHSRVRQNDVQPAQEPVARVERKHVYDGHGYGSVLTDELTIVPLKGMRHFKSSDLLYTHPAPLQNEFARTKSWQGLSNDEIRQASLIAKMQEHYIGYHSAFTDFARAIEQALKEKNDKG